MAWAASSTTATPWARGGDERLHVGRLAVEMNRDEGLEPPHKLRAGTSPRQTHRHLLRIQIEGVGLDIYEDGPCPDVRDGGCRCDEGKSRCDDEILRGHADGAKSQVQGIGPGGHRHRPGNPQKRPQLRFQRRDVGTETKWPLSRTAYPFDRSESLVLRPVQYGNGHAPLSVMPVLDRPMVVAGVFQK
jgi:hypothetical protein